MSEIIKIKQNDGIEKEYDILFSFTKDNKNYITFTDYKHDNNGNIMCYTKEQKGNELTDITDNGIDIIINDMLNTITNSTRERYKKMNYID